MKTSPIFNAKKTYAKIVANLFVSGADKIPEIIETLSPDQFYEVMLIAIEENAKDIVSNVFDYQDYLKIPLTDKLIIQLMDFSLLNCSAKVFDKLIRTFPELIHKTTLTHRLDFHENSIQIKEILFHFRKNGQKSHIISQRCSNSIRSQGSFIELAIIGSHFR